MNAPTRPAESAALAAYADTAWDERIVPALTDYIAIPAKSPMFDADWAANGFVDRVIRDTPFTLPIGWKDPFWAVVMGIEHERIHLETSSVLMRQHALHYVKPHPAWPTCAAHGEPPANTLVDIPGGTVTLRRAFDEPIYGWDNEFGRHEASTVCFQASRYLVSNQEFLAFVDAGGYADDSLWLEEGLAWRQFTQAEHPTFWIKDGDQWRLRLMLEEVTMPWDWPVETNYHEAKAFNQGR